MTSLLPSSVKLPEIAFLLGLTERRIQQLANLGIIVRISHGYYDLARSVQGYINYWQQQALRKEEQSGISLEETLSQLAKTIDKDAEAAEFGSAREIDSL